MRRLTRIIKFRYVAVLVAVLGIGLAIGFAPKASAGGFFDPYTPSTYGSGSVLDGGVPGYVQDIPSLMGWLRSTYYSAPGGTYNAPHKRQAGVAYFVRLLLGDGNSPWVSEADFAKLERLLQPANGVTINFNEWASGSLDTYSCRHYVPWPGADPYDVCKFSHYWSNNSIVVRQSGRGVIAVVQRVCFNPDGNSAGGLRDSNFDLDPVISVSPSATEGGTLVTPTATVNNTGLTASTPGTVWNLTKFRLDPADAEPVKAASTQSPVPYYQHGATVVQSGSLAFPRGLYTLALAQERLDDYPVGTRICFALSVQPRRHDDTRWQHSTPACVTVSKKPKIQVLGNDLIVGKAATSTVVTSSSTKLVAGENYTFGSWGEYGIVASGEVKLMASGAGYSGGKVTPTVATGKEFCNVSYLTFHNLNNSGSASANKLCDQSTKMGNYAMSKTLPDVGSRLVVTKPSLGQNPSFDLATAPSGSYVGSGTISVTSSGAIAKGKWVVINAPEATVVIKNDIFYTGEVLQRLTDIPQVVIIANEIKIEGGVRNIDAWLIANGTLGQINTCSDVNAATELTATKCGNPLTVNGPVAARKLLLYRTGGAEPGMLTGSPAEKFNLRPDAYLWATGYSSSAGRLQTISTKELPPRF